MIEVTLAGIAKNALTFGYAGLLMAMLVSSAGVPIPTELLLPLAGALAAKGRLDLTLVIIISTLGQTLGALLAYYLGSAESGTIERWGKYVWLSGKKLAQAKRLFERHGAWIALFGRCIPGVRAYIGFPAGLSRMPIGVFALASLVGSLIWTLIWVVPAFYLADKVF